MRLLRPTLLVLKLILTLVLFAGLAEAVVRVQLYGTAGLTYRHMQSIQKILMSQFGIEPRRRRVETVGSWGLLPNTVGLNRGVPFRVNNLGLRGRDTTRAPRPGVYRIAVIGGSVSMGAGVWEEETWPFLLERLLNEGPIPGFREEGSQTPRVEVVNLALPNTRRCYDRHLQRALYLRPHLILWQVGEHTDGRVLQRWMSESNEVGRKSGVPILAFERGVRQLRSRAPEHPCFQILPELGVDYGTEHFIYPSDHHPDAFIHGRYAEELAPRLRPLLGGLLRLVQERRPNYQTTWRPPEPIPWKTPEDGFWHCYLGDRLALKLDLLRKDSIDAWTAVLAMVSAR